MPKELPVESNLTERQHTDLRKEMIANGLPALIVDRLLELIESVGPAWGYCPKCKSKMTTDLPVWKYRIEAMKVVLDHTVGKPTERKTVHITTEIDELNKLTDEELAQLLGSQE